ncbi:MAG: PspA/IM30 family protein [Anaerolineae bacterium]
MASLFSKVQTLISANLHALVDKALKANSVAVLDEYIRQAEDNLDDLEDALITVRGQVKTLKRKWEIFQSEAEQLDNDIDRLLRAGKEDLAMAAQSKYNSKVDMAEQYRDQFEKQKVEADKLADAKLKLEAKLTTIKQEREHLLALLELAKSKEIAAKTIRSLDDLQGIGDSDIARVGESIRSRLDRADAAMESYADRLDTRMDEVLDKSRLDDQLAERRRRLGMADE